jgi:hypothetical protein
MLCIICVDRSMEPACSLQFFVLQEVLDHLTWAHTDSEVCYRHCTLYPNTGKFRYCRKVFRGITHSSVRKTGTVLKDEAGCVILVTEQSSNTPH